MYTVEACQSILDTGRSTTEEALQLFDSLDPVNVEFMLGRWRGSELETNHPMNGLLAIANWYGKEFIDPETVHPLLFLDNNGDILKVAPKANLMKWMLQIPLPRNTALKPVLSFINTFLKTENSQARLRMMECRGSVTATMIYDYLPINDSFKKIDDNTVLGIMDYKELAQPFFFVLKREV
ncbi:MAG: DUF4334 domain-containing protein [Snowella sp.]|nr:DUF4334 domain-containing protein [Snowella sp.]